MLFKIIGLSSTVWQPAHSCPIRFKQALHSSNQIKTGSEGAQNVRRLHLSSQHRRRSLGRSECMRSNFRVLLWARLPLPPIGCCFCAPFIHWFFLCSITKCSFSAVNCQFDRIFLRMLSINNLQIFLSFFFFLCSCRCLYLICLYI